MNKSCIKKYLASAFILAVFAGLLVLLLSGCQIVQIGTERCSDGEILIGSDVTCQSVE